jgi:hypothetical protein
MLAISCATAGNSVQDGVAETIRAATNATVRFELTKTPGVPPGIRLNDGLSRDEAVATAFR